MEKVSSAFISGAVVTCLIAFVIWALICDSKNSQKRQERIIEIAFEKGVNKTMLEMRKQAVEVGVGKWIINKD